MTSASGSTTLLDRWDARGRPFAVLPRPAAAVVLALLIAAMAWSVVATLPAGRTGANPSAMIATQRALPKDKGDLALYARIAERVAGGEPYHAAALTEQRASNYPTRPFVAVRLPTLAWLHAMIGIGAVRYAELGLALACLWAANRRLAPMVSTPERMGALVVMALGGAAALVPKAGLIHELWAGLWLTLALLIHHPGRWWPALLAAGMALAVRELAVPFVLLWLAFAMAARRWHEAAGVAALLMLFAGGMTWHAFAVEAARLPGDLASQGWNALAGFTLPLTAVVRLTGLANLPLGLAAPIAILPLLGWAAIGGRLGLFAALWFAGLFTMVALFARPENFYWVQLALPAYGVGLAFAPRAIVELLRGAAGGTSRQI